MKLEIGQVIHQFVVERVLGSGGTAIVYLVRDRREDSYHALKVLTVSSPAIRERMRREGEVQAALDHPNIVPVRDVIDLDGSPALVMEYIEGPSLDAALRRYRLTLNDAELLFGGIMAGVHAAHQAELVHRDLKPANVLLASTVEGFVPKVTDFGLAKIMIDIPGMAHTRQGISMGTPSYMAPEQIRDAGSVDRRADMWSLGCLLYELMTRRRAFPGDEALAIYNAVVDASFTPPRQWVPELPDRIDDAILGCLQLDPYQRIPDVATLLDVLQGRQSWVTNPAQRWADEPSTEDPVTALPAQFSGEADDSAFLATGPSIGGELVLESPGEDTIPMLPQHALGLDPSDLVREEDFAPPTAMVEAQTTGVNSALPTGFDDELPTVAVRLTELVPTGEIPPPPPVLRRPPRIPPAPSLDSDFGSRGPRISTLFGVTAAVVLLSAIALGASASLIGYVMAGEPDDPWATLLQRISPSVAAEEPATAVVATPVPEPDPKSERTRVVARPTPTVLARPVPAAAIEQAPPDEIRTIEIPPPEEEAPPTDEMRPLAEPPPTPDARLAAADEVVDAPDALGTTAEAPPERMADLLEPEMFEVRLLSHPLGARIFVDGQPSGRAPSKVTLRPGTYEVRLESGGEAGTFSVDVVPGRNMMFCYKFADGRRYDGRCP